MGWQAPDRCQDCLCRIFPRKSVPQRHPAVSFNVGWMLRADRPRAFRLPCAPPPAAPASPSGQLVPGCVVRDPGPCETFWFLRLKRRHTSTFIFPTVRGSKMRRRPLRGLSDLEARSGCRRKTDNSVCVAAANPRRRGPVIQVAGSLLQSRPCPARRSSGRKQLEAP
jgi:hypothetical protein